MAEDGTKAAQDCFCGRQRAGRDDAGRSVSCNETRYLGWWRGGKSMLGGEPRTGDGWTLGDWVEALEGSDVVINLPGRSVDW